MKISELLKEQQAAVAWLTAEANRLNLLNETEETPFMALTEQDMLDGLEAQFPALPARLAFAVEQKRLFEVLNDNPK